MEVFQKKTLFKNMFALALPVALQNLLTYAVGLMDSIMVGALGEVELSAVTVANQPFFLFMLCIFGLSSGAGAMVSQYWGKNDRDTISKIFGITIRVSMMVGMVAAILVLALPEQVMRIYTNEAALIPYGAAYLRIVGYSYLLFAFSSAYLNCVRSVERVKIAVITYSISFCVNVFFNYVFIFGKFGAPAMGVAGAAVGTLIARAGDFIIVLLYATKKETRVRLKWKYILKPDKLLSKDFRKVSIPVAVNEMMWALGISAQMAVLGRMGVAAVATMSVVSNVTQFMTVLIHGAGSATLVLTGKYIGARQYDSARKSAPLLVLINMLIAALSACAMLALSSAFISLYNVTQTTKELVRICLYISAGIMVFQSVSVSCIVGIFRGGGDTMFAMLIDLIDVWGIALPLGALGGLYFGLSVPVVFFLLRIGEVIKALMCLGRLRSGKWLHNVTRGKDGALVDGGRL